jgi:ribosomal protein L11 methyltransferase
MKSTLSASYFRLILSQVPSELEDLVSGLCFEHGASGVSENLAFEQTSLRYEPTTLKKDFLALEAYFAERPDDALVEELTEMVPALQISLHEEVSKDWNEEWKKGFTEFPLVNDIWVVPTWRPVPPEAKKAIRIDPGMAFGTGTHETTRLASDALSVLFSSKMKPKSVIDVGTGTGILAILASHLGALSVVGTEIDELARQVAVENVESNQVTNVEIVSYQIEDESKRFDLVMANIIDGVLIELQDSLKACLNDRGHLILTGILEEREPLFLEGFSLPPRYHWSKRLQRGEWVGYIGSPQ